MDKIMALVVAMVSAMAERVAASCADWPVWAKPSKALERIPNGDNKPGIDAFIACCLWVIPEEAWPLSAGLHVGLYNGERVGLVRAAIAEDLPADHPATWWLAMSSLCEEGTVDAAKFLQQVGHAHLIRSDPGYRQERARMELQTMRGGFDLRYGYPRGTQDGCIQGAYLAGYDWAVWQSLDYGIFFIGSCQPSLGLENFRWKTGESGGQPTSGPVGAKLEEPRRGMDPMDLSSYGAPTHVGGSPNFVKCCDEEELEAALAVVREKLGDPRA